MILRSQERTVGCTVHIPTQGPKLGGRKSIQNLPSPGRAKFNNIDSAERPRITGARGCGQINDIADSRRQIIAFYNQQRPHQALKMMTPDAAYAATLTA